MSKDKNELLNEFDTALNEILKANSLVTAKEIAAEALEVDVDEYLMDDLDLDGDFLSDEDYSV
jgi:hypothetical protein